MRLRWALWIIIASVRCCCKGRGRGKVTQTVRGIAQSISRMILSWIGLGVIGLCIVTNWAIAANGTETSNTIPLNFHREQTLPYGVPTVEARTQGESMALLLDLGEKQAELLVHPRVLTHIQVTWQSAPCSRETQPSRCVHQFTLSSLSLGNMPLMPITGEVLTRLWYPSSEVEFSETPFVYDGKLGYPFFSKFNVLIDYPDATLVLYKKGVLPGFLKARRWIKLHFTGQLITPVLLNKRVIKLQWDTACIPSKMNARLLKHVKLAACPRNAPYKRSGQCRRLKTRALSTKAGRLLPATWFQLESADPRPQVDGVMGANFFQNHSVFLDFQRHNIYVKE